MDVQRSLGDHRSRPKSNVVQLDLASETSFQPRFVSARRIETTNDRTEQFQSETIRQQTGDETQGESVDIEVSVDVRSSRFDDPIVSARSITFENVVNTLR